MFCVGTDKSMIFPVQWLGDGYNKISLWFQMGIFHYFFCLRIMTEDIHSFFVMLMHVLRSKVILKIIEVPINLIVIFLSIVSLKILSILMYLIEDLLIYFFSFEMLLVIEHALSQNYLLCNLYL